MTTRLIAVAVDGAIALRLYRGDDLAEAVQLEPKQALLLAIDLLNRVAGRELTVDRIAAPLWGPDRWGDNPQLG
jgi:hypothetical protein